MVTLEIFSKVAIKKFAKFCGMLGCANIINPFFFLVEDESYGISVFLIINLSKVRKIIKDKL
jgi:hypothetical protein